MVTKTHVICKKPPEVVYSSDPYGPIGETFEERSEWLKSLIGDVVLSGIKAEHLLNEESHVHRAAAQLLAADGFSVPERILTLPIIPSLEMLKD